MRKGWGQNLTSFEVKMAKIVRRAAKKAIISAKHRHSLLSLLIFDEKIVCHNLRKLTDSKQNASLSLLKWVRQEENLALEDVFSKVVEVGSIWAKVFEQNIEQHVQYRSAFKKILQEEQIVDEMRKRELQYATKLSKLQKQVEQSKKKSDLVKSKSLSDEMAETLSLSEQSNAELEVKITKHEIFKATSLRDALYLKSESIAKLAKQALSVSTAYKELANLLPDTPTQLTEKKVFSGAGQARQIVTDLAKELQLDPVVMADDEKSDRAYLYAISALKPKAATDSPPTSPIAGQKHRNLTTVTSAGPHPKNLSSNESLSTQRFGHAQSLTDLRPPPSCPPPPLPKELLANTKGLRNETFGKLSSLDDLSSPVPSPRRKGATKNRQTNQWYARSKVYNDESDSGGSDGYTEPWIDPKYTFQNITQTGYTSLARQPNSNKSTETTDHTDEQRTGKNVPFS